MAFSSQPLGGGKLHRPLADINVTPMVDVMLVLLIVFMVTAPMMAAGLKVDLPQAKTAQPVNPKDPIVVSITADGVFALGTDVMSMPELIAALLKITGDDTTRIIQLRADRTATYGAIVGLIDEMASNGLVHIALISDNKPPAAAVAAQP